MRADTPLDDEVDALYGLPLEEFVPARDGLAKRLRADNRRDEADAVKGLRKPSVAAWAANQVLRARPDERQALLAAGDGLRAAQERLLAGKGDAGAAREAAEAERQAVGDLVAAARGLARAGGFPSDTVLDRVRETLHAAATDEDVRAEVASARLRREHRPAAFGGMEGFAAPAAPRPHGGRERKARSRARPTAERERDREAERAREAERKAAEQERRRAARDELKAARAAERDTARDRREAERAVQAANRELAAAHERLERAEAAVRAAAERRTAAEEAV
ncbi:MAG TPA: hypothetical protein VHR88_05670 [Solirubrobacteraceae bacterium]|nr:hypothetical protein [Solirubrobacteraceae bacterium]